MRCGHATGARPAAPILAAPGLLPVRGLAALRRAARGLRCLRQDHAGGRALGASGLGLHRGVRSAGADLVPGLAGAPGRRSCCAARTAGCGGAIEFYVEQARALEDFAGVRTVGIDETSLRRGQHYITVVHDLDRKRLLFATEGREHRTVVEFAEDI